jgi:hypothetical protein
MTKTIKQWYYTDRKHKRLEPSFLKSVTALTGNE